MPLRIAFVSFEYPPDSSLGGIATYVAQAAQLMMHRGHDVEVFASSTTRNITSVENNVLVHWIEESNRNDFPVVAGHRIAERHKAIPFDVIESPEYFADGRKVKELVPTLPLVVRLHTPSRFIMTMSWPHAWWYPLTRLGEFCFASFKVLLNKSGSIPTLNPIQYWQEIDSMEKAFSQKANRVVALCADLKRFAEISWKIPSNKVVLCPNIYHPRSDLLAIEPNIDAKTVGFFGRLERRKGVDLWVKAIPAIIKQFPDTRFRFVGKSQDYAPGLPYDAWIRKTLNQYIDQIDIVDHVALDQMPHQYSLVDICVFPSRWENFPNVCLEAMSSGKAVVGSKHGGMAEMMPDETVGLLVDPFSESELVLAVCRLLENQSERISMGLKARERVLQAYNPTVIGARMEQIFEEAINDSKKNFEQQKTLL
jgi:glycosyltransferase involved in cell wall biosynthesis